MKKDKKEYEGWRKKYGLPEYRELTMEFGIAIQDGYLCLHELIDGITRNIEEVAKLLESVIFVDAGSPPTNLYQSKMLSNGNIDTFALLKRLMSLYWKGKKVKASANEREMADFIKDVFKEWRNDLKKDIVKIMDIFEKEWQHARMREIPSGYSYLG